jgi:predicted 3-demethylubiquinone-9 3-methyltransferase (glyoxalase superfamily)
MQRVRTCLWFEKDGAAAADFYVSLLPDSQMETVVAPDGAESLLVNFTLSGAPYQILNGGPHFRLSEAVSISVMVYDQAEIDRLWAALTGNGGEESQCGWLKDRWGLSWQIYPQVLIDMQTAKDQVAAERTRQAMYKMKKLDIAALKAAFAGS